MTGPSEADGLLLQERLAGPDDGHQAWRMIVTSLMLKLTRSDVAEPVTRRLLERFPTSFELAVAHPDDVEDVIARAGFRKQRTEELMDVSRRYALWLEDSIGEPNPYSGRHGPPPGLVRTWKGCGVYIEDVVRLLVHHDTSGDPPADKALRSWYDRHT
jgi:hypothetical protein